MFNYIFGFSIIVIAGWIVYQSYMKFWEAFDAERKARIEAEETIKILDAIIADFNTTSKTPDDLEIWDGTANITDSKKINSDPNN